LAKEQPEPKLLAKAIAGCQLTPEVVEPLTQLQTAYRLPCTDHEFHPEAMSDVQVDYDTSCKYES
jgi:hypothetical protein